MIRYYEIVEKCVNLYNSIYYVCIIYKRVNQIIIIKSIFLGLIEYSLL